jgi:hypothetical protein
MPAAAGWRLADLEDGTAAGRVGVRAESSPSPSQMVTHWPGQPETVTATRIMARQGDYQ